MNYSLIAGLIFLSGAVFQAIFSLQEKVSEKQGKTFLFYGGLIFIVLFLLSIIQINALETPFLTFFSIGVALLAVFFTRVFYRSILSPVNEGSVFSLTISFWVLFFVHDLASIIEAAGIVGLVFILFCSALSVFEVFSYCKQTQLSKIILYVWSLFVNFIISATALSSLGAFKILFSNKAIVFLGLAQYIGLFLSGMILVSLVNFFILLYPFFLKKKSKITKHITQKIDLLFTEQQLHRRAIFLTVLFQSAYFVGMHFIVPRFAYESVLFFILVTPRIYQLTRRLLDVKMELKA